MDTLVNSAEPKVSSVTTPTGKVACSACVAAKCMACTQSQTNVDVGMCCPQQQSGLSPSADQQVVGQSGGGEQPKEAENVTEPFDTGLLGVLAVASTMIGQRRHKRGKKYITIVRPPCQQTAGADDKNTSAETKSAEDLCPEQNSDGQSKRQDVVPPAPVYQLKDSVYSKIQELTGCHFTLGTGQENTCNAVHASRCVTPDEFLQADLANQVVWLDPPPSLLYETIKHYVSSKAKSPDSTRAVLVVPHKPGAFSHMLKGMQRIMVFNRRNAMFETSEGHSLPLRKEKVSVYYDPPYSTEHLVSQGAATMTFVGTANQFNAVVALDTQASTSFVSSRWLQRAGVAHTAVSSNKIELADGRVVNSQGRVSLKIKVGPMQDSVSCQVLDMPGFDIILGDDWMSLRRVHLDFGTRSAFAYIRGKRHTMRSAAAKLPLGDGKEKPPGLLLTALQVKRVMRKKTRSFLVQVKPSDAVNYKVASAVEAHAQGVLSTEQLDAILREYEDVFADLKDLPPERRVTHLIPLEPGARPIYKQMYRLTQAEKAEVEKQVAHLLSMGYIEPSSSPWGAPVLFVPKPDGSLRMCIDYRALNKVTVKNRYPMPRIDDLLEQLHGATVFSGLDLASGYWQIRVEPQDVEKTAFRTHVGHFQWRVLAFGLTNCPATFQQCMNDIFRDYMGKFVVVYLDDILIYSKTPEEHEQHIRLVLQRLREHQLFARRAKCHFNQPEVTFLGHVVGVNGVKVDPRKVQAVQDWPIPTDVHQLRSFLGLANYFRKFIQGYSTLVRPLTDLLRDDKSVQKLWSTEAQHAFDGVKWALTHAPVLVLPDFDAAAKHTPFEVVADASLHGIGAVLLQGGRPIAFESKKFSPAEKNYDTSQRELLALIHALKTWRCYLEGVPFKLVTDHHPNTFFETQEVLSPRMARWYEFLTRFAHMQWEYRPGRLNVADPLSRLSTHKLQALVMKLAVSTRYKGKMHVPLHRESGRSVQHEVQQPSEAAAGDAVDTATPAVALGKRNWSAFMPSHAAVPKKVRFMDDIYQHGPKAQVVPPPTFDPGEEERRMVNLTARIQRAYAHDTWFAEADNVKGLIQRHDLYWKLLPDGNQVLVIPNHDNLRTAAIEECHDALWAGHTGLHKTLKLAERTFWWPTMRADIEKYVLTCIPCQRNKSSSQKKAGLLQPLPIPGRRWETVSMDLITGLPTTELGRDAILVFVDKLSKMVKLVACNEDDGAIEIAQYIVENIFKLHGLPRVLLSDRDPRFTSNLFREICKLLKTKQALSSAFHPETDGQTERVNRVVEEMLRHYTGPRQDDWDKYLFSAEFAINNSYNESIQTTPFWLNSGQHPLTPVDVQHANSEVPAALQFTVGLTAAIKHAKELLAGAQDRQKAQENENRRELILAPGELVWLNPKHLYIRTPGTRKLLPRFVGPFEVLERVGETAYRLKLPKNMRVHNVFHVSLLKLCRLEGRVVPHPNMIVDFDVQGGYKVEMVLTHSEKPSRNDPTRVLKSYLVKYEGLGPEYNAWVPEKGLQRDYPEVLQQYWSRARPRV